VVWLTRDVARPPISRQHQKPQTHFTLSHCFTVALVVFLAQNSQAQIPRLASYRLMSNGHRVGHARAAFPELWSAPCLGTYWFDNRVGLVARSSPTPPCTVPPYLRAKYNVFEFLRRSDGAAQSMFFPLFTNSSLQLQAMSPPFTSLLPSKQQCLEKPA